MDIRLLSPARNPEKSIVFYQKLGFQFITEDSSILLADSQMIVELSKDNFARPGLKMLKKSWSREIEQLKTFRTIYSIPNGYAVNDGNGCWVYMIENGGHADSQNLNDQKSLLGNFYGLSLEVAEMEHSVRFWSILGFAITHGKLGDSYLVMTNEESFSVSLMQPLTCPHLFFNPSLSFFNSGNNLEVIERINALGIPFTEEITLFNERGEVDNVIIRDPGGYGFFVFND